MREKKGAMHKTDVEPLTPIFNRVRVRENARESVREDPVEVHSLSLDTKCP